MQRRGRTVVFEGRFLFLVLEGWSMEGLNTQMKKRLLEMWRLVVFGIGRIFWFRLIPKWL